MSFFSQAYLPEGYKAGDKLVIAHCDGNDEWVVEQAEEDDVTQVQETLPVTPLPPVQRSPSPSEGRVAYNVRLDTTVGAIDIIIRPDWAPNGAHRFLELAACGDLDDLAFYRAVRGYLVQFGLPAKRMWPPIPDDPATNVPFLLGAVCFAAIGANSRKSTLFVCTGDMSHCFGLNSWETPIGAVTEESLEVLDRIETSHGDIAECGGTGPDTSCINSEGNSYLRANFPNLTYIRSAWPLDWPPPGEAHPMPSVESAVHLQAQQDEQVAKAAQAVEVAQAAYAAQVMQAAEAAKAVAAAQAIQAAQAEALQVALSIQAAQQLGHPVSQHEERPSMQRNTISMLPPEISALRHSHQSEQLQRNTIGGTCAASQIRRHVGFGGSPKSGSNKIGSPNTPIRYTLTQSSQSCVPTPVFGASPGQRHRQLRSQAQAHSPVPFPVGHNPQVLHSPHSLPSQRGLPPRQGLQPPQPLQPPMALPSLTLPPPMPLFGKVPMTLQTPSPLLSHVSCTTSPLTPLSAYMPNAQQPFSGPKVPPGFLQMGIQPLPGFGAPGSRAQLSPPASLARLMWPSC